MLVCGVIMFGLAWRVWLKADQICGLRRHHRRAAHPVGPFVYFMAVMVAITGIVHLVKVVFPARLDGESRSTPTSRRTT